MLAEERVTGFFSRNAQIEWGKNVCSSPGTLSVESARCIDTTRTTEERRDGLRNLDPEAQILVIFVTFQLGILTFQMYIE